ncbi:hypothetical protein KC929_02760 [Patescibacteria group bacterium]|nr:hypothetical protein [Patescibacteria group bacterium]
MKTIILKGQWIIKAPLPKVFTIITDFEKFPEYFPKVAESVVITGREGNHLEITATVKSFGRVFPVSMKTEILPGRGFISDNQSPVFGTSGHEELLLSEVLKGTMIDYTYQVSIHKPWLRLVATPFIKWFAMWSWKRAVIDKLRRIVER